MNRKKCKRFYSYTVPNFTSVNSIAIKNFLMASAEDRTYKIKKRYVLRLKLEQIPWRQQAKRLKGLPRQHLNA